MARAAVVVAEAKATHRDPPVPAGCRALLAGTRTRFRHESVGADDGRRPANPPQFGAA